MPTRTTLFALVLSLTANFCSAADWPAYRADSQRSGIAQEELTFPLAPVWVFEPDVPPMPAWPDPVKEHNRVDFDYAPQVIVAQRRVYFGSTTDDTLRALDAATGEILWKFITGGPIRFAPAWFDGKIYLASDDGQVYCLDAASGKLQWKFNAAETDSLILGNGRLISRRPLRSGLLVEQDTVYCTAGMWPSEGVLVHALDAQTGQPRWCNDTSDTLYLPQPHAKAYSLTGIAPQGYLLAAGGLLLVPNGRGVPAAFDLQTGRLRYFEPSESKSHGGTWATIGGDRLYNGGLVYELATGRQIACPDPQVPLWAKQTFDYGSRQHILGYRGERILVTPDEIYGRREGYSLALAGNALLEGSENLLTAYDVQSKRASESPWQAIVDGEVRGLAVSDGRVLASTHTGKIYCFATADKNSTKPKTITDNKSVAAQASASPLTKLLSSKKTGKGLALLAGEDADAGLALARQTSLHVVTLESSEKLKGAKENLLSSGRYGTSVSVIDRQRLAQQELPAYVANVVVLRGDVSDVSSESIWHVLRPCGGLLCLIDVPGEQQKRILESAPEAALATGTTDGIVWYQRGKLPGAFDWNSEVPADTRVQWPLELSWFGGPGPARMQDRHRTSVPPPIVANGRYFVAGERHVIAVDAYNGTELWSYDFAGEESTAAPAFKLNGLAADDNSAYVQLNDRWLRLDAQSGEQLEEVQKLPEGLDTWGRITRRVDPYDRRLRNHALTGESVPRVYYRAYGCNQLLCSEDIDFFRSGTLGFYDLNDDSGLRNFGGVRPACSRSHNAAFGIFLSSEGSSGCTCTYSFQTSLGLAPTEHRPQEDWAIYYDSPTDGQVRQMAVNLGAPGDRRDEAETLWLNYPRPELPIVFQLPVQIETAEGVELGPYHFDTDRTPVAQTDRPWIYSSGYRGVRKIEISLDQRQPVVAQRSQQAPQIDGQMAANEWQELPTRKLHPFDNRQNRGAPNRSMIDPSQWNAQLYLRHDDDTLYVAFHLPNQLDRRGEAYQWRTRLSGEDAGVWSDDSYELFLSDEAQDSVLHLGVSAAGATYDAKYMPGTDAEREDAAWDGKWQSAVVADEKAFTAELAIPYETLSAAGLDPQHLTLNAQTNWNTWSMPLRFLGSRGRLACENFTSVGLGELPQPAQRRFRVRLHFAEPDDVAVGQRQFDVLSGGQPVLSGVDVRQLSKGRHVALTREFETLANDKLTLEFKPKTPGKPETETLLNGLEIEEIPSRQE